jgi:hypothetical protein
MREKRLFDSQPSVAAEPPPLDPNPTEIRIQWVEDMGMTIKIRLHHCKPATKICSLHLKPDCLPGHEEQLALDVEPKKLFASRSGRRTT